MSLKRMFLQKVLAFAVLAMLTAKSANASIIYSQNFDGVSPAGATLIAGNSGAGNAGPTLTHPNNVGYSTITSATTAGNIIKAVADAGNIFGAGTSNQFLQYVDGATNDPRAIAPAPLLSGTGGFQMTFDFVDPVTAQTGTARVLLGASNLANESVIMFFNDGTFQAFHASAAQTKVGAYTTGVKHTITVVGNYSASTINYGFANSQSVASGRYDTWVDGTLYPELNDALFRNVVTSTTHMVVNSSNAANSSLNIDNVEVRNDIVTSIPEPCTFALAGLGLLAFALCKTRERK